MDVAIYKVDFNAVHPETWYVLGGTDDTEQRHLSPTVGDRVLLVDPEQNRCMAWIAAIDGSLLQFKLVNGTRFYSTCDC